MKFTKEYYYKNDKYIFFITRKKIKNFILKQKDNNSFALSIPYYVSIKQINSFLDNIFTSNKLKLIKKQNYYDLDKEYIFYFGNKLRCIFWKSDIDNIYIDNNLLVFNSKDLTKNYLEKNLKLFLTKNLNLYIKTKLKFYQKKLNLKDHTFSIRNKISNWGSNKINKYLISFAFNLIFYPREAIDYVIVHELIHSIEPNHLKGFYNLLKKVYPNYKNAKLILKNYFLL